MSRIRGFQLVASRRPYAANWSLFAGAGFLCAVCYGGILMAGPPVSIQPGATAGSLLAITQSGQSRTPTGDSSELRDQAKAALLKAVKFFAEEVAVEGGYVWRYSPDLRLREGEGKASDRTVWVQPPGTPVVGEAFLKGYECTGERNCLEAAQKAGLCLARGQLRSGGWTYRIEFDPKSRTRFAYRIPPSGSSGFNVSTLDDDTTQSAVRFLVQLDKTLGFQDPVIHESARYALEQLIAVQYPNGAWPQGFQEPPAPQQYAVLRANYPDAVPPAPDFKEYWRFYTLNDNALVRTIRTLLLAARVYQEPRYREAAIKAGRFLLLAQMPEPQPAWAQQYNFKMQPAWARKFEPPAISGLESQEVLRVLMELYAETGSSEFLEPIPRALAYLKRSVLPNGQLARFYELRTNRPLFFTKQYVLTYDDSDLPTHYGFKVDNDLAQIEREFTRLKESGAKPAAASTVSSQTRRASSSLISQVRKIIESMDARGAWIENGRLRSFGSQSPERVIQSASFVRNLNILSQYLATEAPR